MARKRQWLGFFLFTNHLLHRIAAVVLMGVSFYHIFDIAFSRAGRELVRDLFPTLDDARGAWQNLCYYLGLTSRKPEFARFNYAEKAEYWALVWGMIVMAVTGIMLRAKVSVGNHLPRWWLDIATAIHFYEAELATLAIISLALLPGVLRPRRLSHELGVVGRKNDAAPLSGRTRTRHCHDHEIVRRISRRRSGSQRRARRTRSH